MQLVITSDSFRKVKIFANLTRVLMGAGIARKLTLSSLSMYLSEVKLKSDIHQLAVDRRLFSRGGRIYASTSSKLVLKSNFAELVRKIRDAKFNCKFIMTA